jgi:hypothetical protein
MRTPAAPERSIGHEIAIGAWETDPGSPRQAREYCQRQPVKQQLGDGCESARGAHAPRWRDQPLKLAIDEPAWRTLRLIDAKEITRQEKERRHMEGINVPVDFFWKSRGMSKHYQQNPKAAEQVDFRVAFCAHSLRFLRSAHADWRGFKTIL